ncbi:MAG: dTDP-4-dehydrorhamnose reductase [Oscillibacter sp.]|nr:dTDP-4-dehydrorhamnose reductase [Oscillibacter sp.]
MILVTGATGQLGYDVCRCLKMRGMEYTGLGSADCDITDLLAVRRVFREKAPHAIIHCAAYTQVDRAEDEPEKCMAVNAAGTQNLALACRDSGAKMLYISSDYVFPGNGDGFYKPDDETNPQNIYGKSKLAGEIAVRELVKQHFIVRTSWVFGKNGGNFIKTMLQLAQTHDQLNVVGDQVGSPTYSADLAILLCDMIETEKYGIYHATNEGTCSWAELAAETFRLAGKNVRVKAVTTEQYGAKAARPHNSRMSKDKLDLMGFSRLPVWTDAVQRFLIENK